jgi:putative DNA primase/helicase
MEAMLQFWVLLTMSFPCQRRLTQSRSKTTTCLFKVAILSTSSGFIARERFKNAMLNAGLVSNVVVVADRQIHRFKAEGDKNKDSWYVFYGDGGAFGNWRTGLHETWFRGDMDENRMREIRKDIVASQKTQRKKIAQQHRQVARTARRRWDAAAPAIEHSYLAAKKVQSHGLRIAYGDLLIPLLHDQQLWSLQTIAADGDGFKKRFLWLGRKSGCYFPIGTPGPRIWLAEGYSTTASVHEVTGEYVVCAFDSHNLVKVAANNRARFIDHVIWVAADNDDAGIKAATDAMKQHNLEGWVAPDDWKTDWNDHCSMYGAEQTLKKLNSVEGHR